MANVKFTKEDWGGDQAKADAAQTIANEAWDKTNPAGTLVSDWQKPTFDANSFSASGALGDYANKYGAYGQFMNAYENAWQRANPADRGVNSELITGIADGSISGKDIANNYYGMAAQYMDKADAMGDFSYDFNKDPLFQMLSQSYMTQARNAASDASALAATRTGGYGNSYGAVAAGQQYNDALKDLYSNVPELEEAAYNRYNNQKNDYYALAGYYGDMGDTYYNRGIAEEQTAYDREQDAYAKEQDAYTRKYNEAVAAAELGEYGLLEDLLGIDLSIARSNDQLNKVLTIIQSYDGEIASASALIQTILAQGLGTKKTDIGKAAVPEADAPKADASGTQANAADKKYGPTESAGQMVVDGETVWLPPAQTMLGTYEYFMRNGGLMYTFTDAYGRTHTEPYRGVLLTTDGRTISYHADRSPLNYPPSYPIGMTDTPQQATNQAGGQNVPGTPNQTGQQTGAIITGDPYVDAALELNGVNKALQNATPSGSYIDMLMEQYGVTDPVVALSLDAAYGYGSNMNNGGYDYGGGNTGNGNTYTGGGNSGGGNTYTGGNSYSGGGGNSGGESAGNGNAGSGKDVDVYSWSEQEWKDYIKSLQ